MYSLKFDFLEIYLYSYFQLLSDFDYFTDFQKRISIMYV